MTTRGWESGSPWRGRAGGRRLWGARVGFTLVEIIVVLLILGVAATVVVPPLRAAGRAQGVRAAANDVAQVLRMARHTALEQAVPVMVMISPGARQYWVEADRGDTLTVLAEGTLALAAGVRLASERRSVRVVFDRLGPARPDSIVVQGDEGSVLVGVDRWSGDVYVRLAGR